MLITQKTDDSVNTTLLWVRVYVVAAAPPSTVGYRVCAALQEPDVSLAKEDKNV